MLEEERDRKGKMEERNEGRRGRGLLEHSSSNFLPPRRKETCSLASSHPSSQSDAACLSCHGQPRSLALGPRGNGPLGRLQCVHTQGSMRAVARTHRGPRGTTEAESSPGAILGQTQNWSQWRFCLCNICTRSFGANNPGPPGLRSFIEQGRGFELPVALGSATLLLRLLSWSCLLPRRLGAESLSLAPFLESA